MPCSGSSALHGVNPNLKRYAVMYPEIFWGDFLWGFQQGVWGEWGTVMPPYGWVYAKLWLGPGGKAPGNSKDLVLWNHFLLIKIYSPQPVMKLIQHFFSKILPKLNTDLHWEIHVATTIETFTLILDIKREHTLLILLYRAPGTVHSFIDLIELIENVLSIIKVTRTFLLGDFNLDQMLQKM